MGGSIQVPNNIEDKTVLKRFLTDLVMGINGSTLFSGNVQEQNAALLGILKANPNLDFLNLVSKLNELRTDILTYVEDNLETVILQQQEDVAVIAEQFGTFYNQALAASWYGLSVKAGGAVAGLEIGSLDPDVTTPGDESSYFRVVADNFIVGRAYEDLTQEEKDYLAANSLPNFGTVYNAQKQPVPALITSWDSVNNTYKHYFNGIVQFSNISSVPDYALTTELPVNVSELTNDVGYSTTTEVNGLLNALELSIDLEIVNLQNQIDGSISTWFNSYVPTLSNIPAIDWNTNELKNQHLGDLFYDRTTGYAYRFAYEDIDDTPDAGVIYSWVRITDTDITLALQKAADAQATADGKITTFYKATAPTAEGIGDIWIDSDNNNKMHLWNGTIWTYVRDTSKDAEIASALQSAADAQDTADGKIESFFQSPAPSSGSLGDIWFDTDDGNKVYRHNGTTWVQAQDSKIAQALLDAADARSTADGKITTFYQASSPTAEGIGDLWVTNNSLVYRWDGSNWILLDYANAINNGTTTINGGKITTNTVEANVLKPSTGGTTVWSGGALVSQNFNGNSVGAIGSPTQGFRLSSNASGTSSDPNIYGAYIKASYVESLYAPVVGTNNSGRFNYAASGTTVSIVGPNYSSGYISNRVVSITNSIVIIKGTVEINTSTVQTSSISKYLQRSINGGAYSTIQTKTYYHNITTIDFWVTIDVYVYISIYIPGQGTFSGSDTDHQAQHVIIYPTMRVITSLEFYYIENLSAIGDFNSLSYTIPDGVVSITIHN